MLGAQKIIYRLILIHKLRLPIIAWWLGMGSPVGTAIATDSSKKAATILALTPIIFTKEENVRHEPKLRRKTFVYF